MNIFGNIFIFFCRSRGFATGITAAFNYTLTFVTTKTYLNLENGLGLSGVIWFYGAINILGFIFLYFTLPETENCTLEDIENHFSDNNRKFTDINIKKSKDMKKVDDIENGSTKIGCDNRGFNES